MSEPTQLTDEQTKAALHANKQGFITHALASGKTEDEAEALYKSASARADRRENLAITILESVKGTEAKKD